MVNGLPPRPRLPLASDDLDAADLFADVTLDVADGPDLLRRAYDAASSHPVVSQSLAWAEGAAQRRALVASISTLARRTADAATTGRTS